MSTDADKWTVSYAIDAARTLARLDKRDRTTAQLIRNALLAVAATGDPRSRGTGMTGDRAGQWRYRIGDWRVIADIYDNYLIIRAVKIGHRSTIYRK